MRLTMLADRSEAPWRRRYGLVSAAEGPGRSGRCRRASARRNSAEVPARVRVEEDRSRSRGSTVAIRGARSSCVISSSASSGSRAAVRQPPPTARRTEIRRRCPRRREARQRLRPCRPRDRLPRAGLARRARYRPGNAITTLRPIRGGPRREAGRSAGSPVRGPPRKRCPRGTPRTPATRSPTGPETGGRGRRRSRGSGRSPPSGPGRERRPWSTTSAVATGAAPRPGRGDSWNRKASSRWRWRAPSRPGPGRTVRRSRRAGSPGRPRRCRRSA